ncbi:HD domain-containing protein [Tissierella creatinophila]|uniref:Ribonuclease Y n=1 Tax=Tissierella creatinophila DSM 6911 TaxID=1123403 RepID=A0A1U7M3L2_TISCR|nr:HD domain-containing protein [Tissierella creatinophila]OLS01902.1 ribonuclease Y [Tissierella creatinophila DSM 6911]
MDRINCLLEDAEFLMFLKKNEELEVERVFCHHDITHFLDVCRIAMIINCERELNIDKELIYAAGLLHDIGRWVEYTTGKDHAIASAQLAEAILKRCQFTDIEIKEITLAIISHRDKEHITDLSSLLYEADKASRPCFNCNAKNKCKRFLNGEIYYLKY